VTEISIIVPFFNVAPSLGRCLEALLQQDDPACDYEVIAVDNNSSDGSLALARRYPAVRVLSESRQSSYAARNCGLRAAAGRLLAFTDPDCVPRRDWLRRLTEAMTAPEAMVAMGRDRPSGRSRLVRLLGEYDHFKEFFVMASMDPSIYYGHTNNLMTRREVFERVGLFEEWPRGADVVFVHRVLALYGTGAVRYEPEAVVDHLEIDAARIYFRKAFVYGQSARRYARVIPARPLRNTERIRIFRDTVRGSRLSATDTGLLLVLLIVGVGFYYLGWLSGRSLAGPAGPTTRTSRPTRP
jgi:glycosyltransferase involved in cell wall biosynthesis